ncbi:hypothetical protein GCM10009791_33290 [Citricoccus zhacaiensis]
MVASAQGAGVRVWTGTPVQGLVTDDDGAVTGALLSGEHAGTVRARLGVALAGAGGTAHVDPAPAVLCRGLPGQG